VSAAQTRTRYWPVQLLRAIPALVIGLVITFSAIHTASFGLITFGGFALATGILMGWGSFRLEDRQLRAASLVFSAIAAVSGAAALALNSAGPGALFLLVIIFGATTGFLELYLGLRARGRHDAARDWIAVGVLTALLAIAVLLVPADYSLAWSAADAGVAARGVLTSQIIVVGIFGAYAILVGVYLAIGGLSNRWSALAEPATSEPVTGQ